MLLNRRYLVNLSTPVKGGYLRSGRLEIVAYEANTKVVSEPFHQKQGISVNNVLLWYPGPARKRSLDAFGRRRTPVNNVP